MCRALMYLGEPAMLHDFLYKTDSSLIKQVFHPRYTFVYNLAGFGTIAWEKNSVNQTEPFSYRSIHLPFYDPNLRRLSQKIRAHCFLAHVRGGSLKDSTVVSERNVHPFMYDGYSLALAHNGDLEQIDDIKVALLKQMKPSVLKHIKGSTDTELVYALLMSQFDDPCVDHSMDEVMDKVLNTIKIIDKARKKVRSGTSSELNLFITNGDWILATRFVFDFGYLDIQRPDHDYLAYQSLWYTFGEQYGLYEDEYKMKTGPVKKSIIIASEPLTKDTTTWFEVPESFMIAASVHQGVLKVYKKPIVL